MKKYAIIVAGGLGLRMGTSIPKQYLEIDGTPIIILTIRKFLSIVPGVQIIVVVPKSHRTFLDTAMQDHPVDGTILIAEGGDSRTASVQSGLSKIDGEGLVAIHDAVRPFVNEKTILASFHAAEQKGSGVASVPLKDSIREVLPEGQSQARDRAKYVLVQTPQTFQVGLIKDAYSQIGQGTVHTDDATVLEKAGTAISLVEGSYENIKITTAEDLRFRPSL
ncbi:MAG: 2-C-methyl-D-erythritol 4-phosphate cytidylyltransferase [Bacteroidota bacterium]